MAAMFSAGLQMFTLRKQAYSNILKILAAK